MRALRQRVTLEPYQQYREREITVAKAAVHQAELWLSSLPDPSFITNSSSTDSDRLILDARQSHHERAIALNALLEPQPPLMSLLDRGGWIIGVLGFLIFTFNTILSGGLSAVGGVSLVLSIAGFVRGALVQQIKEWRRQALEAERALLERERSVLDQIAAITSGT